MNRTARPSIAPFAALLCAASLLAAAARAQSVAELVPADAYSSVHWKHDPDMAYIDSCSQRVWDAVRAARFDQLIFDGMAIAGANPSDRSQAESLVSMVGQLINGVDWKALVEHEMVYAEIANEPIPQFIPMVPSVLFAARVSPAKVAELEGSLSGLLRAADAITDELTLSISERQHRDDSMTRVYSLKVVDRTDFPLIQMAVRGERILLGFGPASFASSLAILNGDSRDSLVNTRRYRKAVGELSDSASSVYFFDSRRFMKSLKEQLPAYIEQRTDAPWQVTSVIGELLALTDTVETSVTTTRVDGLTLISECTTRYTDEAVEQQSPMYVLATGASPSSSALLEYVPATALSFSLNGSMDFRPLYRWCLERVETYLPESADSMLQFDGLQAAMDLSIEDDLLSWIGSESVSFSLPATTAGGQPGWVSICQLRDPEGARKVIKRLEAVYTAVVPQLLERAERELGSNGTSLPKITLEPSHGSYPNLNVLRFSMFVPGFGAAPVPPITYGIIGNLFVMTSSEAALDVALATAAGELDGLYAHPAFEDEGRLSDGPIQSASLVPIGRQLAETGAGLQMAAGLLNLMSRSMGADQPQAEAGFQLLGGSLQKVGQILGAIDFIEDTVTYRELRDGGRLAYQKSTTRYVAPDQR